MRLKKLIEAIKSKKILDLKSIIIEITLIFIGITLAAKYNQYQTDSQDEKFLKETIFQIHSELKNDKEVNGKYYLKGQVQKLSKIIQLKEAILKKDYSALEDNSKKKTIAELQIKLSMSNSTLGFKKLIEKDINLLKNEHLKNKLLSYYEMMDNNLKDLDGFNKDIEFIKPFLYKHFRNIDFFESNFESIVDKDKFVNDNEFLNILNTIILDLKINISTNKDGIIPRNEDLTKELEKEFPFLLEKKN